MNISQPEELNPRTSNPGEKHGIARRQQQWTFLVIADYS